MHVFFTHLLEIQNSQVTLGGGLWVISIKQELGPKYYLLSHTLLALVAIPTDRLLLCSTAMS